MHSRRRFLQSISLGAAALTSVNLISSCARQSKRPNIIFFIADDMRPDMFNCLPEGEGKNLTPHLDRLAGEGTLMLGQHVVSPVCTPSRYNCLTGNYAGRSTYPPFLRTTEREEDQTVIQWNTFITPDDETLPKYLQRAGYVTGFAGKNHVIAAAGLHFPKDYNSPYEHPENKKLIQSNYAKVTKAIHTAGFDVVSSVYQNNPNFIGLAELAVHNLDWVAQGGLDFIEQHKDQPFFLYFATTVPHGPYEAERSWNANPLVTANGYLEKAPDVLPPRDTIPQRIEKAGLCGRNKENLLWLDDAVGALLDKLEEHGLDDNTIIFFFNDHGQLAKGTVYQGGVHNPSIVWKKGGFPCGGQTTATISNIDFAPTILEFAGFDGEAQFDGKSFKPLLDGQTEKGRESLFFELGYARGIRKGDWKYIAVRYPSYATNMTMAERAQTLKRYNDNRRAMNMDIVNTDPSQPFSHMTTVPGGGHAEFESTGKYAGYYDADQLYNLADDPGEQNNRAYRPEYQEKLIELKKALQVYIDDLPGTFTL